ncbi:MAG TPA: hypothetical protein VJY65_01350 [Chloroflexota bacterium]|nr:hypothetical protein [Chloroflexota bacterium]
MRNVKDTGLEPMEIGIRYETPNVPAVITEAQAIQVARDSKPGLEDQATSIATRYLLFSDDQCFTSDAMGQKHFVWQRVPAWVVTFTGVNLSSRGGDSVNHEVNIVIDARTGEYLLLFSYR